jgi:glycosyltransferase involved in cell wall biosynthesis
MNGRPYFSIVIPTFNREREIRRALNSCLDQSFRDFEIIVVDDGSDDNTTTAVADFSDQRVSLIKHSQNRGLCATRQTGVNRARGEWVLFLDSDDEYNADALSVIYSRTIQHGRDADRLGFMYRIDTGGLSPNPPPGGEPLDYAGYIRWSSRTIISDFHNCIRRSTFEHVSLPVDRAYDYIYHLNFARHYKTQLLTDVVGTIHTDAKNRSSNLTACNLIQRCLQEAQDGARSMEDILNLHGPALRAVSFKRFEMFNRMRLTYHFLAGNQGRALRLALHHLTLFPLSFRSWLIPAIGILGPRVLASAAVRLRSIRAV